MLTKIIATTREFSGIRHYYSLMRSWLGNGFGIENFQHWLMEYGMGYLETKQWWMPLSANQRPYPHEGVDLYSYMAADVSQVKAGQPIPMICDGVLAAIHKDFIGFTFLVRTNITDPNKRTLYLAYAHVAPAPDRELTVNTKVYQGDQPLVIASSQYKCPAHLHLSTFWAKPDFDPLEFDWATVNENNKIELVKPVQG